MTKDCGQGHEKTTTNIAVKLPAINMAPHSPLFFQKLADNSPLFIGMCDMHLVPFYLNAAGRELVGLDDLEHFKNTAVHEFFFPEDQDFIVNDFLPRVLKEGRAQTEVRFRHFKTGEAIWMTYDVFFLGGEDGTPAGLATVSREITQTKQVEQELRESEERFSAIVNSAMDAIIALDEEQNILLFNPAAEKMFGRNAAEALGRKIDLFIPRGSRENQQQQALVFGDSSDAIRNLHPLITTGLRNDGSEFPIEASISRLTLKGQQAFSIILHDITERSRAESALRDSEERFASFMRHLPGLAWIKQTDGQYIFVNDAAAKAFQKPRDEICGKVDEEIFSPEVAAQFRSNDAKTMQSDAEVIAIETLEDECGVLRHSIVSKFPIKDYGGTVRGIGGVAIDVTDRIMAEESLKEAAAHLLVLDRHKDEFLATLAHELRNPLAPIANGLQVLRSLGDESQDEKKARIEAIMERQVNHLIRLVDDLIDIARINRGKITLQRKQLDLHGPIHQAVEMSRHLVQGAGVQLHLDAPPEPMIVNGDAVRLTQIFANLLNNATKYTPTGGSITISARLNSREAIVSVADTGVGIPQDMLSHVFDLFTQIGERNERARGLGIGLALVKKLAELHGGSVSAESPGKDMGSTFVVRLPLALKLN